MTTANMLFSMAAAAVTMVLALIAGVIGIWRISAAATGLKIAVNDNTAATEKLSGRIDTFSAETSRTLAEYGERLTRLENKP